MKLTVVIPCRNEAANLEALVEPCRVAISHSNGGLSIVLVDHGSTDDSAAILNRLVPSPGALRVLGIHPNRGYGGGIVAALQEVAAGGDELLGWTHADLQTDPSDLLRALEEARRAGDPHRVMVKGTRSGRPWFDAAFSVSMGVVQSVALGERLWEINAQPTIFSRSLLGALDRAPTDFRLDLFAMAAARLSGFEIRRIPVRFPPRVAGVGHNDRLRQKLRTSWNVLAGTADLRRRLGPIRQRS